MNEKFTLKKVLLDILMVCISMLVVVPLLVVIMGSFKTPGEAIKFNILPPTEWHPENYIEAFIKGKLGIAFKNSLLITATVVAVTTLICSISAFIIQRRGDRLGHFLSTFFSMGLIIPMAIVPTIIILQFFHIMNTKTGFMFVMIAMNISWSMFILTNFMGTIPRELDEAAVIDGCGPIRLFYSVIFPNLKSVLATNLVIIGMGTWNDLQTPLYILNSGKNLTMPLTVYNFMGRYFSDWNLIFADLVLVALPMVVMYVTCQKHIISGVTAGAVKG